MNPTPAPHEPHTSTHTSAHSAGPTCIHCAERRRSGQHAITAAWFVGAIAIAAAVGARTASSAPAASVAFPLARGAPTVCICSCPAPPATQRSSAAPPVTPQAPPVADSRGVEVRWGPGWYPGEVLRAECEGFVRIRFTGYGPEWDEVIPTSDVRDVGTASAHSPRTAAPTPLGPTATLRPGLAVLIEWHGTHYPGRIVRAQSNQRATIHYDGYGSDSDEVVTRDRLFRPDATSTARTALHPAAVDPPRGQLVDPQTNIPVGVALEVRDGPSWYRAHAIGSACAGLVRVRYDGWEPVWDTYVPRDRVRTVR